ncbi:MAG: hypothetical protein ACKOGA_18955, partial [Planctomycetaceae bacterium]
MRFDLGLRQALATRALATRALATGTLGTCRGSRLLWSSALCVGLAGGGSLLGLTALAVAQPPTEQRAPANRERAREGERPRRDDARRDQPGRDEPGRDAPRPERRGEGGPPEGGFGPPPEMFRLPVGMGRLLLVGDPAIRQELKLGDEQSTRVAELSEKLQTGMRENFEAVLGGQGVPPAGPPDPEQFERLRERNDELIGKLSVDLDRVLTEPQREQLAQLERDRPVPFPGPGGGPGGPGGPGGFRGPGFGGPMGGGDRPLREKFDADG